MKKILLHINPSMLPSGGVRPKHGPKFFPLAFWQRIVDAYPDYTFYQIGINGDWVVNNVLPKFNLSEDEIVDLAKSSDHVLTIDSFLPHLLAPYQIRCIVLFSRSNPELYGYDHNINILKDRKFLAENQFGMWKDIQVSPESYVTPQVVIDLIK